MKLESLKSEKFSILPSTDMKYITGGGGIETGSGSSSSGLCYSNDWSDSGGRNYMNPGGGDFKQDVLQALIKSAH